jgi:putative ABC transport system permease protein
MSLWRQLTHGVRALVHRSATDQDLADEVQYFFDRTVAEYVAEGMPRDEAVRAARRALGGAAEEVRVAGWEAVVDQLLGDVRYAVRRLRRAPAFTTVSTLTLAIGIGAVTAIFSAVKPILFEPLPYPDSHRLLMISDYGDAPGSREDVTFGTYNEVVARTHSFTALAVAKPWQPTLLGATEPERLEGQQVSASYFHTLGIEPRLGHDFDAADDHPNGAHVVIVSDALWRRRLNGDPAVVGRQVTLDGNRYTVIGIMPAGFENILSSSAEVWSLLQYDISDPTRIESREWGHHLAMIARVRPELSVDAAVRDVEVVAATPMAAFNRPPWASLSQGAIVHSLWEDVTQPVRPALLAILGAVFLVLTIACVNVTNLLLARGAQRRGELAMRAALGATRRRILGQLLTESLVLALLGGALGLAVATFGTHALVALSPRELPRVAAIHMDAGVFAFALTVTTCCGILVGLVSGSQRTRITTRSGLVVAEVALALVLLVSAGLLLRSLQRLFAVPPGFAPAHVLTMQVQDEHGRVQFFRDALDAVRHVPGVTSAAFTSQLPLSGDFDGYGARLEGTANNDYRSALLYRITPGYLETMGIPLRRGRLLDDRDWTSGPRSVLVSESFVRHNFAGQEPIGGRLQIGPDTSWITIVGVVGDVKHTSLALDANDAMYISAEHWRAIELKQSLVVRTGRDAAAIKAAIWSVDKTRPIVRVRTMDQLLAQSEAQRRFALTIFEAFGLVALMLAAIGLYGVLAGSVTERLREMGIRSALGASPIELIGLVVRQGMTLAVLGVGIGVLGATAAGRAIAALLFGISWLDPVTYVGVVVLLLGVALVACWLPARRACGVAPVETLRAS